MKIESGDRIYIKRDLYIEFVCTQFYDHAEWFMDTWFSNGIDGPVVRYWLEQMEERASNQWATKSSADLDNICEQLYCEKLLPFEVVPPCAPK